MVICELIIECQVMSAVLELANAKNFYCLGITLHVSFFKALHHLILYHYYPIMALAKCVTLCKWQGNFMVTQFMCLIT